MNTDNLDILEEYEDTFGNFTAPRNATEQVLKNIFSSDPILSDIPCDISYEEVLAQIAVAKGQAITIFVERETSPTLKVIVPEEKTTVSDLKKAILRAFDLEQNRLRRRHINDDIHHHHHKSTKNSSATTSTVVEGGSTTTTHNINTNTTKKKKISWRYIWRTYLLDNNGQLLIDDNQSLFNYGVVNKTILKLVKRCKYQRRPKKNSKVHAR